MRYPTREQDIAMAAGWDAGNRNMRREGRTQWNLEDWGIAARTSNAVLWGKSLPPEATRQ